MTLVLASASTSRAKLLDAAGIGHIRDPADIDETRIKHDSREEGWDATVCAMRLAEAKAKAVAARHKDALVLGADQMLECDGYWFDKPADRDAARTQLRLLAGKEHTLITAAAVVRDDVVLWRAIELPRLTLRAVSDEFLDHYLDTAGDTVLRSVGAYELEGLGVQLMAKIDGDHFSILGLPMMSLLSFLRAEGALLS